MKPEAPPEESRISRDTRAPLVAAVKIEYTADKSTRSTYTANVSLDGLFVLVSNPRPVGTKLGFELQIQREGHPIRGFGEIRWIRVRDEGPGHPAGMGILIQMMIGEEGEAVLRAAITGALKASRVTDAPVPAPALDMDSPDAKQALAKARKPAVAPEGAPGGAVAGRAVRPQVGSFKYGMHAQRSAELRSKRRGTKSGGGLDDFMRRLGFTSKIYLVLLPLMLLLIVIVILMIF
jgi:hypothetical protein